MWAESGKRRFDTWTPSKPISLDRPGFLTAQPRFGPCDRQARPYLIERTGYKLSLLLGIDDKEAGVVQERTETEMFTTRKLGQKQANLFDAGGFVSGIEWCPMAEIESSSE